MSLIALLVTAQTASASEGCVAPDGTAATDQYCELLTTAEGPTDATGTGTRPLVDVLPNRVVELLKRSGLHGQTLLALPATAAVDMKDVPAAERMAVRRANSDPRLGALLPGDGPRARSLVRAAGGLKGGVGQGFAWTLVLTLLGLAGLSMWGSLRGWSVP